MCLPKPTWKVIAFIGGTAARPDTESSIDTGGGRREPDGGGLYLFVKYPGADTPSGVGPRRSRILKRRLTRGTEHIKTGSSQVESEISVLPGRPSIQLNIYFPVVLRPSSTLFLSSPKPHLASHIPSSLCVHFVLFPLFVYRSSWAGYRLPRNATPSFALPTSNTPTTGGSFQTKNVPEIQLREPLIRWVVCLAKTPLLPALPGGSHLFTSKR